MMEKLWGDNYFNPETKKFTTDDTTASGKILPRSFCEFIMNPIIKLCRMIMEGNKE